MISIRDLVERLSEIWYEFCYINGDSICISDYHKHKKIREYLSEFYDFFDIYHNNILHYLVLFEDIELLKLFKENFEISVWKKLNENRNLFGEKPCHWVLSISNKMKRREIYDLIMGEGYRSVPPLSDIPIGKKVLGEDIARAFFELSDFKAQELFNLAELYSNIQIKGLNLEQRFKRAYLKLFVNFGERPFTVAEMKEVLSDEKIANYQEVIVELRDAGLIQKLGSAYDGVKAKSGGLPAKSKPGKPAGIYKLLPFYHVREFPVINVREQLRNCHWEMVDNLAELRLNLIPLLALASWFMHFSYEKIFLQIVERISRLDRELEDLNQGIDFDFYGGKGIPYTLDHFGRDSQCTLLHYFIMIPNSRGDKIHSPLREESRWRQSREKYFPLWDSCFEKFFSKKRETLKKLTKNLGRRLNLSDYLFITILALFQELALKRGYALSLDFKYFLSRLFFDYIQRECLNNKYSNVRLNFVFPMYNSDYFFYSVIYFLNQLCEAKRIKLELTVYLGEHIEIEDFDFVTYFKEIFDNLGINVQVKKISNLKRGERAIITLLLPHNISRERFREIAARCRLGELMREFPIYTILTTEYNLKEVDKFDLINESDEFRRESLSFHVVKGINEQILRVLKKFDFEEEYLEKSLECAYALRDLGAFGSGENIFFMMFKPVGAFKEDIIQPSLKRSDLLTVGEGFYSWSLCKLLKVYRENKTC